MYRLRRWAAADAFPIDIDDVILELARCALQLSDLGGAAAANIGGSGPLIVAAHAPPTNAAAHASNQRNAAPRARCIAGSAAVRAAGRAFFVGCACALAFAPRLMQGAQ